MLKISKFDLLQDDYTDALAERIIDDFATGEKQRMVDVMRYLYKILHLDVLIQMMR
ncbi:hypothetical protein [Oribacterium sp. WCC10]|uniref:hypothetical protein n=1 Tax=Oribacterium sp. WCC10 TaxID=1855343 RepID=UPI0008E943A4|nr:hypothetical protein [Oribacterium sp. WCC10]SFG31164.1 hypothetical protein SAMN05216356_105124 [Oribacterium sp. WCC10]